MNSWSGSSAPPGRWNMSHRQSTAAEIRRAALRRVPPQPQPLTASSRAGATAIRPLRVGGRRVSLPGSRLPLPGRGRATARLKPMPVITQRCPRTGSAWKPAILSPNANSPRCSDAPPAAGHLPGSPKHDNHRQHPTQ